MTVQRAYSCDLADGEDVATNIRNHVRPAHGARKKLWRTVRNVQRRTGRAQWLMEPEIELLFDAIGWASFPDGQALDMVAREVNIEGEAYQWVRIDPDSVEFDANGGGE